MSTQSKFCTSTLSRSTSKKILFPDESLQSTIPRLLKLATDSIHTSKISPQAIKTVRLLVSDMNVAEPKDLTSLVTRLIESIRPEPFDLLVISEIYQLLTASHEKYRNIIDELPEDLIRKSIDSDSWCYKLTDANLAFQMFRLQWFLIYTNEREIARQKLSDVMKNKDVHQIFANGLKNSNEGLYEYEFGIVLFKLKVSFSFRNLCTNNVTHTIKSLSGRGCF